MIKSFVAYAVGRLVGWLRSLTGHQAGGLILSGAFMLAMGGVSACQPYDVGTVPPSQVHASPAESPFGNDRPTVHVAWLSVPFCENSGPVGLCAIWDDRADTPNVDPAWWVEPLGRTYPDGATLYPECKDSTGTGWPCVWPGHYGDPDPSREVGEALVFGPEDTTGGVILLTPSVARAS